MRELLLRHRSTNGRWGVESVGETEYKPLFEAKGRQAVSGQLRPLGRRKWTGYKGRDSGYRMVTTSGAIEEVPVSLLIDAGIVQPKEPPKLASPPPPFASTFADALRKAGYL